MSRREPVWMHHDDLDRTIQVVRSQVPHLGAAGWREVDPPAPEPDPAPKESKGAASPRATSKESES